MSRAGRITLAGCLAVVIFDVAASAICRMKHLPYEPAKYGSDLIYACVGFFVAFTKPLSRFRTVVLPALAVGLCDATVGWFASCVIGPGKPTHPITPVLWVIVAVFVMLVSLTCAMLGFFVAWLTRRLQRQ